MVCSGAISLLHADYPSPMDPNSNPLHPVSDDQSLTEGEYDRMEALLGRSSAKDAMNLEEMDGFFTALICGSEVVLPSQHLDEIWGGKVAPFANSAELEEFIGLAMRQWNSIAQTLGSPDLVFKALLWTEDDEELPRGNRWARGFMRAIDLHREAWSEIFEKEECFAMLLAPLALTHENDPDPEMRTWKTPPGDEVRANAIVGLSVSAQRLFDYFRSRPTRKSRPAQAPVSAAGSKIGRNDPCYCGSGKKYKRCCGNVTVN
jgi:uncharacterized protein